MQPLRLRASSEGLWSFSSFSSRALFGGPLRPLEMDLGPQPDAQRAREMRLAATRAVHELSGLSALPRAAEARPRVLAPFEKGELVAVRRRNKAGERWREGPGVVLMQD